MRKFIFFLCTVMLCCSCSACLNGESSQNEMAPQASQMRSICELATMQCYYHNVAKYSEEDASGILFWTKDRHFWVEYAGVVTIGIDASQLDIAVNGDKVTITIPPAKVLSSKVDETTLTEASFIVAKDSAAVEAEHQTEAFKEAQRVMQEEANNDTVLLANAQQRAQKLLEDYVNNIGKYVGKTYTIEWIYLDDASASQNAEEGETSQQTE